MFKALHSLAQHCTGLTIGIVAENDIELRVTVQPIAGEKAPIINGMVLTGTPEDLEANFVEAIETYEAPVLGILEQAKAAAAKVGEAKGDKKALPAPATSKPAAKAPAKPAAKAAAKPAKKKAAPEPAAAKPTAKPGDAITIEQDKLACIADMRAYLAGNAASAKPVKPSRADYLKKFAPATGRRYERLFASFDEFVAAAQQQALPEVGEAQPNAEAQQPGEPNQTSGSDVVAAASDAAAGASAPADVFAVDPNGPATPPPITMLNPQPAWPMVPTTDDGTPAPVALKDLQAPSDESTSKLFEGEPALEGEPTPTLIVKASDSTGRTVTTVSEVPQEGVVAATPVTGFALDII